MNTSTIAPLTALPKNLPLYGAIAITLQDGVMIFRASQNIQQRIENLLDKREEAPLTETEEQELDDFAAIDDYLSFVNRMIRNNFLMTSESSLAKDWLSEEENEAWKDLS
ncbi:hypothetical protein [Pseudanabaena yagii]|uniref:Uncharacterized protein n=1 Tax=Pseudanabaena yagii GIHE-NHR1 TaxID=2722753 RepID=A0ABX1LNH8_9CYAN|nr:hypothetical protein [Pseudanabaena yagii]NMF57070.1 hypothetical protein [Pseudanabaena yagii GIHE-NHR1]